MTDKIQVFQAEQDAGLEHLIEANASIAYEAPLWSEALLRHDQENEILTSIDSKPLKTLPYTGYKKLPFPTAKASKNDSDIYHVYSILVSTSWNKNDDVFDKDEVWASKHTPKYKPTNLEHDEKQIVGGIIDNWAVDDNFNLIDENLDTKELPDRYHILVSSVIYKQWQDPEYRDRVLDLIEQIEAGTKYVSMECIFRGFDYAVVDPKGKNHIIARNDETAFLTQHLRSYGGTGAYQDHQVGRLLRNITFSGKGFVNKPANPESVIFDKNKTFEFNKASISSKNILFNKNGVVKKVDNPNILNKQESYNMSNEILNDQVADLKASLESVKAENKTLTDKLAEANVEKYEQSIEELNDQLKVRAEEVEALTKELEDSKTISAELTTKFETVTEAHDKLESRIAEMDAAEKARSRKSALIEAGLSDEEAEAKVETFESLSDEQFTVLAETFAVYTKTPEVEAQATTSEVEAKEAVDTIEDTEASEEKADEEVLETVQAEEASTLVVESDSSVDSDDGIEVVRAGLQDWVQAVILNNNSNSGE
mgnify:CR=1 FL=1